MLHNRATSMARATPDGRPETGIGIERHRACGGVHRFSHEAMATVFGVHVIHPDERYAAQAAYAAFDLADRLERDLSRFLPNSDISRINRLAAGECTPVSPSTLECLAIARHLFELTGGAFDASIGTGLPALDLDGDRFKVRSSRPGVQLDLGGIGKGYAVDCMAALLEEWGLMVALVHGGYSTVLALDAPADGDDWSVTLSDPDQPARLLQHVGLRQAAVSASGRLKGAHIVDPRGGEAGRGRLAAWVLVPRPRMTADEASGEGRSAAAAAAVADALSTACMLMSADAIGALCARSPGLKAWVLHEADTGETRVPELVTFGETAAPRA